MHILASQTRRIDDGGDAVDLGQSPADILFPVRRRYGTGEVLLPRKSGLARKR